jgi:hypothetical protein
MSENVPSKRTDVQPVGLRALRTLGRELKWAVVGRPPDLETTTVIRGVKFRKRYYSPEGAKSAYWFWVPAVGVSLAATEAPVVVEIIVIALALIISFHTWRHTWLGGVLPEQTGVKLIREWKSTIVIPWSDISHFEAIPHKPGRLHLRDGSFYPLWLLSTPNPSIRPKARLTYDLVDELNARLAELRSATADQAS